MSAPAMITHELVKQWQRDIDQLSARHPHDLYVAYHPCGCATVENSRGQRLTTVETTDEWLMFYTGLSVAMTLGGADSDALDDFSSEASSRF